MTIYSKKSGAWQQVRDIQAEAGGSWRRILTGYVKNGGVWKQVYTYDPTIATTTSITYLSSTTMNAPLATVNFVAKAVRTDTGANVPDGTTMQLYNGATLLQTSTTTGGIGAFTFTPSLSGVYTLTVKTLVNGYYLASQVDTAAITAHSSTWVTGTSPSPAPIGTAHVVTGTVHAATGQTITAGTVSLTVNGVVRATSAVTSSGTYSLSWTPPYSVHGNYTPTVTYSGSGLYYGSSAPINTSSVGATFFCYPACPATTVVTSLTAPTDTTFDFYFDQVAGAQYYDIYVNGSLTATLTPADPSTFISAGFYWDYAFETGLTPTPNSHWPIYVVTRNDNPTTGSATSNTITINTVHPEVRSTGSVANVSVNALATDNYRSDGWGTYFALNEIVTGSNGGFTYWSVAQFSSSTTAKSPWWNYMNTNYGAAVANNATVTGAEVYLSRRTSIGTNTAATVQYFYLDSAPGVGTPPSFQGGSGHTFAGPVWGAAGWYAILASIGTLLYDNTWESLGFYGGSYAAYYGLTNVRVRLDLSWNFVSSAYAAAYWS